ncbi:hypothetical protein ACRJ4W_39090 [Streptomyces sp. GLT-R25]
MVLGLEEALDAPEQEILAREDGAKRRLEAVGRQLPGAERDLSAVHDERVRAEEDERVRRGALATQEGEAITSGRRLRTALSLPGVIRGAGLDMRAEDEGDEPHLSEDDADDRTKALRRLVEGVRSRLDAERRDISDTALLNRHTDLRDQLSGGYTTPRWRNTTASRSAVSSTTTARTTSPRSASVSPPRRPRPANA